MTLTELKELIEQKNPDAPLIFSVGSKAIGAGYHVTELKASDITSIDCAGNMSQWTETALQLLDGAQGDYMKVGKFIGILNHSFAKIDTLKASRTFVEFSPLNDGLRVFEPEFQETGTEIAQIQLIDTRAHCKPSLSVGCGPTEAMQEPSVKSGCCGGPVPDGVDACCVKDADAKSLGQTGCGCNGTKLSPQMASDEACCV